MLKRKKKKEKVYICTACYLEENPYGNGRYQGIFLSDIYLKEKNGKYVNYFKEEEEYPKDQIKIGVGDIKLIIREEKEMTPEEVFLAMFYNKNYCKDRIEAMDIYLGKDRSNLQTIDFHRYHEILEIDSQIQSRYERYPKNKVLVMKGK